MLNLAPFVRGEILIPLTDEGNLPCSLALNSKEVRENSLFIAIPGNQHDGASYIEEALQRGASVIVMSEGIGKEAISRYRDKYPYASFYMAPNVRKVASFLASCFYPLQPDTIVAVTGTNGKTSTVSFIRQIWCQYGKTAASLGTLGLCVEGHSLPNLERADGLNTPDSVKLHQILQTLKEEHIDNLVFEASSHGLHQYRLDGVRLKAAVFTNLTNDHLDYHQTMESYFEAKSRLFRDILPEDSTAILNKDIPEYERLEAICRKRNLPLVSYGKSDATIQLMSHVPEDDCQEVSLLIDGKTYVFTLPLVGEFQVYNVMAALGAVRACGEDIEKAVAACKDLKGVPGRLEKAAPGVYVDYAHTPDALNVALKALRPHTKGKLWVVFGCGGDRDSIKRPMMGEIAAKLADKVIVTDDNPRYENPEDIRKQILAKCPEAREIPSRHQAIARAVQERNPEDVVLIAGKGHESYQLVRDQVLPFNDVEEVKKCVRL